MNESPPVSTRVPTGGFYRSFYAYDTHEEDACCGDVEYEEFGLNWQQIQYLKDWLKESEQAACLCQQCLQHFVWNTEFVEGGTVPEPQKWEWRLRFHYAITSGITRYCTVDGEQQRCDIESQWLVFEEVVKIVSYCT